MKFEGCDYDELGKAWRIKEDGDGTFLARLKERIQLAGSRGGAAKAIRATCTYKDCRAFLRAHIAYCERKIAWVGGDYINYMRGIQKARDPWLFLQFFGWNLERMWV